MYCLPTRASNDLYSVYRNRPGELNERVHNAKWFKTFVVVPIEKDSSAIRQAYDLSVDAKDIHRNRVSRRPHHFLFSNKLNDF